VDVQSSVAPSARQEWAAAWQLPIIGMLGVVATSAFLYSNGILIGVMTKALGWTRSEFSSALSITMLASLVFGPVVGRLVDRYGPRRVALTGCFTYLVGMSLLATANGSIWQWRLLCVLMGACIAPLSPTTWITAVSGRFNASRGLALAIVLAGSGGASALWPILSARYVEWLGWRATFPAIGISSMAVVLPLTLFFFHGPVPVRRDGGHGPKPKIGPTLLSRTFMCILLAGLLFTSLSLGLVISLVPILTGNGFGLNEAAGIASLVGLTTLLGRFVIGIALDHLPTRTVGLVSFLMPIPVVLLLWQGAGSLPLSIAGVALLGFTTGAESDVLAYLASRRIERSIFASVYAIIIACYTAAAGTGPLLASLLYDTYHSYAPFLLLCVPMALVSAVLIWLLPNVANEHQDVAAA
jgi:MFS family permease